MKLTAEQICAAASGAVRFREEDGLLRLFRFSEAEEQLYNGMGAEYHAKALSSAGMRLNFRTDSAAMTLSVETAAGSSRRFFSFDVFVNGEEAGHLDNFSAQPLPADYTKAEFPLGTFEKRFDLGVGIKTVTVYLPWSVSVAIRALTLDDGALWEPVRREKTLLVYGDSITQGYDALRPSAQYTAAVSELLQAEEINKAIGREVFCPALAELAEPLSPDYVLVSYGSNDWNRTEAEDCARRCRVFFRAISARYPAARIFAVTPIWRADWQEPRPFGAFSSVGAVISAAVEDLPNVTVLSGGEFVPRDISCFSDGYLHPNDQGFSRYGKHISRAICEALGI